MTRLTEPLGKGTQYAWPKENSSFKPVRWAWNYDPWTAYLLSKGPMLHIALDGHVHTKRLTNDLTDRLAGNLLNSHPTWKAHLAWSQRNILGRQIAKSVVIQTCSAPEWYKRYRFSTVFQLRAVRECDLPDLQKYLANLSPITAALVIEAVRSKS